MPQILSVSKASHVLPCFHISCRISSTTFPLISWDGSPYYHKNGSIWCYRCRVGKFGRISRIWSGSADWKCAWGKWISPSASLQKPLTVLMTTNYGKFLRKWECLTTLSLSWEIYMWDKKQQLELDMEQLIGSKLGKEYDKAVYCLPAYICRIHHVKGRTGWIPSQN